MNEISDRAELTVDGWPSRCRVVGVVVASRDPEWAAAAVDALSRAAASRSRPAFLVDLAPSTATDLRERLGADRSDGLARVDAGEASFADVAVHLEDRSYAYLPAGRIDRPGKLAESPALELLTQRVRDEDGAALVLVDRGELDSVGAAEWCDGWVVLGSGRVSRGALPGEASLLGRIRSRPERPEGELASARGFRLSGRRRSSSSSSSSSSGRLMALGLFVAAWLGVSTCFVHRLTSAGESMPRLVRITAERTGTEDGRGPGNEASGASAGFRPVDGTALDSAATPHSVLVASYGSEAVARKRIEQLTADSRHLFYLAPTPVRGRLWYRVYAGSRPGRAEAERLMEELVDAGVKEEARNWDLRAVPWTFRLGSLAERAAAGDRVAELQNRGIPAYFLPVVARGDTVYRLYSGAYETREDALALQEQLADAGVDAQLLRRGYGEP